MKSRRWLRFALPLGAVVALATLTGVAHVVQQPDPTDASFLSPTSDAGDGANLLAGDLTAPLGLSQPTVSHHLRILTEAGLLEREKRGVWAYYRLVPSAIATIADLLTPPRKRATKKAAR